MFQEVSIFFKLALSVRLNQNFISTWLLTILEGGQRQNLDTGEKCWIQWNFYVWNIFNCTLLVELSRKSVRPMRHLYQYDSQHQHDEWNKLKLRLHLSFPFQIFYFFVCFCFSPSSLPPHERIDDSVQVFVSCLLCSIFALITFRHRERVSYVCICVRVYDEKKIPR